MRAVARRYDLCPWRVASKTCGDMFPGKTVTDPDMRRRYFLGRSQPASISAEPIDRSLETAARRVLIWIAFLLCQSAFTEANWPSFQNGGQLSRSDMVLATQWSPDDVAWSSPILGYGQSSPVIWEDQIYVTSVSGPRKESFHVTAFRLSNSEKLWPHDLVNVSPVEDTGYASRAAGSVQDRINDGPTCHLKLAAWAIEPLSNVTAITTNTNLRIRLSPVKKTLESPADSLSDTFGAIKRFNQVLAGDA